MWVKFVIVAEWNGKSRWWELLDHIRGHSELHRLAKHQSARLSCHEFSLHSSWRKYHSLKCGKTSSESQIICGQRISNEGLFHRRGLSLNCPWIKVVFKRELSFGAELLTCETASKATFCSDVSGALLNALVSSRDYVQVKLDSWLFFSPHRSLFILHVCSGTTEWMASSSSAQAACRWDGSDCPVRSLLHPPISAAHIGLMRVRYYLFDVTRGDQILCAWPLLCCWSLWCGRKLQKTKCFSHITVGFLNGSRANKKKSLLGK